MFNPISNPGSESEVACYVLTRVITVCSNYLVVDAGFLAVSKDSPELNFGKVVYPDSGLYIAGMSQEAGKLKYKEGKEEDMKKKFKVGDLVRILPAHSCHTAAFHPNYHLVEEVDGEIIVQKTVKPCRGW